jgi:hypothetical protein
MAAPAIPVIAGSIPGCNLRPGDTFTMAKVYDPYRRLKRFTIVAAYAVKTPDGITFQLEPWTES